MSYTQSFGYDELNRLSTSNENSGANWSQTNSYDRYGNRTIVGGGLGFNASNNRISGWSYDAAGNLLNDSYHTYTYDSENKISKVDAVTSYTYDGEGQRVRKLVGENLRFVYDMAGKQIAEFDGSTGALKKEYVYGVGGLITTIEPTAVNANGTRYTTSDNLSTPRVVTNSSAGVVSRHDYKPFGEELGSGIGGRTTGMGFIVADGIRQKFTSKERDIETGLDYSINRYYSSTQGRFTSADPMMASAKLSNPQTMNRYVYVINNPLRYIDPNGLDAEDPWSSLTKKEQLLLASKLTTVQDGFVPNQKQLAAAGAVFNEKVKAQTKDGLDVKQTLTNIASMKAFVAQLGSNKQAWAQVDKIGQVQAQANGEVAVVTFTVKNDDAFIGALKNDPSYRYREKDFGHTDSFRLRTIRASDPSFHIDRDGATFGSHWDPTSTFNFESQESVMNGVFSGNPMGVAGGVAEMVGAGSRHYGGKATVEQVQKFLTPSKQ